MNELPQSQQDILFRLKTKGALTARVLAQALGMTTVGIRQHLTAMQQTGYVLQAENTEQKPGRGRPVRPWHLTGKGHRLFPDAHAEVTVALIASVKEVFGDDGLDALIAQRTHKTLHLYQHAVADAETLPRRLQILSELRSDEGYMSEVKELGSNSWLLIENHCPICAAATACQGFCRSELEVFQEVLGDTASIERINHILSGARRCAYKVTALT